MKLIINHNYNFHKTGYIYKTKKIKKKMKTYLYAYGNLRVLLNYFCTALKILPIVHYFHNLMKLLPLQKICKSIIPKFSIWNCSLDKLFFAFEKSLQKNDIKLFFSTCVSLVITKLYL